MNKELFARHAELCKTLADGKRLKILYLLGEGELSVSELAKKTGIRQANVSQHLAVLRSNRFVRGRRAGLNVFYRISDARIVEPCGIFKELHGL